MPVINSLNWNIDKSAPESEVKEFWKKLRYYYRAGEKPVDESAGKLSSALQNVLGVTNDAYPYCIDDEKKVTVELGTTTPLHLLDHLLSEHQKDNRKKFKNR